MVTVGLVGSLGPAGLLVVGPPGLTGPTTWAYWSQLGLPGFTGLTDPTGPWLTGLTARLGVPVVLVPLGGLQRLVPQAPGPPAHTHTHTHTHTQHITGLADWGCVGGGSPGRSALTRILALLLPDSRGTATVTHAPNGAACVPIGPSDPPETDRPDGPDRPTDLTGAGCRLAALW